MDTYRRSQKKSYSVTALYLHGGYSTGDQYMVRSDGAIFKRNVRARHSSPWEVVSKASTVAKFDGLPDSVSIGGQEIPYLNDKKPHPRMSVPPRSLCAIPKVVLNNLPELAIS